MFEQLGLIGCGLMGGSFALAMKKAGLVKRVIGYSNSVATMQTALRTGVIDFDAQSALKAASGSDLIVIAVPVGVTPAMLSSIKHIITAQSLVMDLGSTKRSVMDAAISVLGERVGVFVGAHPIAGKESSGVEHAQADLYWGKKVILTPIEATQAKQLAQAQALWQALGCHVIKLSAQAHDAAYAAVSHLPHLLAFALINAITAQPQGLDFLRLAGTGFRDFTRIAASDAKLWSDVFMANREELLAQSRHLRDALQGLEQLIQAEQAPALETEIQRASLTRKQWSETP